MSNITYIAYVYTYTDMNTKVSIKDVEKLVGVSRGRGGRGDKIYR